MSFIAAGVAVAGVAASAAMAASADAPDAPDYAAANREGVLADIETLPLRRLIEQASKAGTKITYTDPRSGEQKTADFTGLGDADLTKLGLDASLQMSDAVTAKSLELSKKYGEEFVAQRRKELQATDPTGWAMREKLGSSIMADLEAGKALDPALKADVVNTERAAQAARGNIMGQSSAAAEAMSVGDAGFRLWQQKLANAASFLSGTTPVAQFGQLSGAQQGASPFSPVALQSGAGLNPNAGQQGASYALGVYGQQSQNWATAAQNNPWTSLLGSVAGVGVGAAAYSATGGSTGYTGGGR